MIKDGSTFPETLNQPHPKGEDINKVENIQFPEVLPPDPQNLWKSAETIDANVALRNFKPAFPPIVPWNIIVNPSQSVYLCDATDWPISVTLLTAIWNNGLAFTFKKIDSTANKVTLAPVWGQTIDYNANIEIDIPMTAITIVSDGSNYFII